MKVPNLRRFPFGTAIIGFTRGEKPAEEALLEIFCGCECATTRGRYHETIVGRAHGILAQLTFVFPLRSRAQNIGRIMPETDLSILVVSYFFPPNPAVGGKRVARFCQYLPDFGIRPIVLTIDQISSGSPDHSIQLSTQPLIVRARPRDTLLDRYHGWAQKGRVAPAPKNGSITTRSPRSERSARLRDHLLALLQFPDVWRGWYRPAMRAANRIIRDFHIDVLLSSGPPWTAHDVAHSISRRYNIPWVADFRDAWTSDPWRKYNYASKVIPAWRERLDHWAEGRWTSYARMVICTTSPQRDCLLATHPNLDKNRVIVIPNGLESTDRNVIRTVKSGVRQILHAGSLYRGRRLDIFCRAVESLVRRGQLSPDMARITLMGDVDADIERDAFDSVPDLFASGMIAFQPRVDWEKARQATDEADVLLIFQGHHPTAIPAKFYEYMQTGKPIVAIVGSGALRDIVVETGSGFVADPDNQTEIECVLEQSLRAEPRQPDEVQRVARQFDFRNLTAKLAESIREAAKLSNDA